ncbi:hypothetical protein AGMMS50268_15290 [Spirochaetia bacterium]|nr:hypothetical protein AGMMS50268_15290 [Spirochaetia bacterium]
MNFGENDPVTVIQGILDMILNITKEVYDQIELGADFDDKMSASFRDTLNMCAVYIDMGIITIATGALCFYGAAAPETPKLTLAGSGDIVLKAAKSKQFYSAQAVVGGSPAGAIHEKLASVQFGAKCVTSLSELSRDIAGLVKEGKKVHAPDPDKAVLL